MHVSSLCKPWSTAQCISAAGNGGECYAGFVQWIIAGLGNPDEAYTGTRHNTGRDFLRAIAKKEGTAEWRNDTKLHAFIAKTQLFNKKVSLLLPETYMNNSGAAFHALVASKKQAEMLAVLHDELDLPLGAVKISFGAGAGGHKGVESIQKAIKTKNFVRIRIGISPATPTGKLRKPDADEIVKFVLGKFKPTEEEKLEKSQKIVAQALEHLLTKGCASAMTHTNTK